MWPDAAGSVVVAGECQQVGHFSMESQDLLILLLAGKLDEFYSQNKNN